MVFADQVSDPAELNSALHGQSRTELVDSLHFASLRLSRPIQSVDLVDKGEGAS